MQLIKVIFLYIALCTLIPGEASGQIWPFKRKSQAERATQDLERRRRDSGQGNFFNPLQPMGSSRNYERNDHIWSAGTAYISTQNSGNISISSPSRYGIHPKSELQSVLGAAYWVPNLFLKRQLYSGNILISSRHGVYVPSPGLNWAKNQGYHSIADTTITVPHIITFRNELIASKPFIDRINCADTQPWLIVSAAVSFDYSIPLETSELRDIDEHIAGSRNSALTGKNLMMSGRLSADGRINESIFLNGGFRYFWNRKSNNGFEHYGALNMFITRNTTISPGYILSIGDYGSSKVAIFPFFDITWYFGRKPGRRGGLYEGSLF